MKYSYIVVFCIILLYGREKDSNNQIKPDIIIGPGGQHGYYTMGICHYIRNHFNLKNKKIVGFSSGSWATLILTIKKKYITRLLMDTFSLNTKTNLNMILGNYKLMLLQKYKLSDFNLDNTYIAVTHVLKNKLYVHNQFLSFNEYINCCISSSFIPFVTYTDCLYFYKNNLVVDGGLKYTAYVKEQNKHKNKPLIVDHKMFGRFSRFPNSSIISQVIKTKNMNYYNLYINGYHDASVNHKYLETYFSIS